jgi:hypothetical protein
MPLHADTVEAPGFLRISIVGDWPSAEERVSFRQHLIQSGFLTADTRMLIDLRGLTGFPAHGDVGSIVSDSRSHGGLTRLHAYIAESVDQVMLARALKQFAAGASVGIFKDERSATEWLWNADPDF